MGIVRDGNCPGWELSGMGIVRWEWELSGMGIVRDGKLSGMGIVRDGNCPGWELSGMGTVRDGNCPGWELSGMGTVRDGNCPDTVSGGGGVHVRARALVCVRACVREGFDNDVKLCFMYVCFMPTFYNLNSSKWIKSVTFPFTD